MSRKTLKKSMAAAGENAREAISSAAEKAGPLYDQTRDTILEVLEKAGDGTYADAVRERADELPDSVRRHLPEAARPAKKHHRLLTGLGIIAVIGAVFLVVRQILLPKDDGWTPHEPSGAFGDDDVTTDFSDSVAEPETAVEEAAEAPAEPAGQGTTRDYGPGSYVGANPPEGYTTKGNERSMKYHTPNGAGYSRPNADVWFVSTEAAEAAGFTKALR